MPFGSGGRRCIGERLAYAEMKIFLSMLARKVDYELVNEIKSDDDSSAILWKKHGIGKTLGWGFSKGSGCCCGMICIMLNVDLRITAEHRCKSMTLKHE